MTTGCDTPSPHDLFHAHIVVQELRLEICAQRSSSAMTSCPRCWQSQPQAGWLLIWSEPERGLVSGPH